MEPATKADTAKLKRIYGGKWSWDILGTRGTIHDAWGSGWDNYYAVTSGAGIRHVHAGEIDVYGSTMISWRGIWGSSRSDVYAVGTSGNILHFDGQSWQSVNSGTSESLYAVWGDGAGRVFAVGGHGTILHGNQ